MPIAANTKFCPFLTWKGTDISIATPKNVGIDIDFTWEQGSDCVFHFTSFAESDSDKLTYFWEFGDGTVSIFPNPSHEFPEEKLYLVKLAVTGECGTGEIYYNIDASCSIFDFEFQRSCPDGIPTVFFQLYNPYGYTVNSIVWDFGDGFGAAEANPVHEYETEGIYNVKMTVNGTKITEYEVHAICDELGHASMSGSGYVYDPGDPAGDGTSESDTLTVIAVFINTGSESSETALAASRPANALTVAGKSYTATKAYTENPAGEMEDESYWVPVNAYGKYSAMVFQNVSSDFRDGGELKLFASNSVGSFTPAQVFFVTDEGLPEITTEYLSHSLRVFSQTWDGDTEKTPWIYSSYHKVTF